MAAIDAIMALVFVVGVFHTLTFGLELLFVVAGEFGSTPCDCDELQARLETVNWTGEGVGVRFSPLVIEELGPPEPYKDFVLQARTMVGEDLHGESIARRIEEMGRVERIPPLNSPWGDFAFQLDQAVLLVHEHTGEITLLASSDADATLAALDAIAEEIGEAERPTQPEPSLHQRITTALGPFRGTLASLGLASLGWIWLVLRATGVVRRATSSDRGG